MSSLAIQILAENKICAALESGAFRNLSGAGKPLDVSGMDEVDPAWRMADRLLRTAGMAPAWIELDLEIRSEIAELHAELRRSVGVEGMPASEHAGLAQFARRLQAINAKIDRRNLFTPAGRFQRPRLELRLELDRLE